MFVLWYHTQAKQAALALSNHTLALEIEKNAALSLVLRTQ